MSTITHSQPTFRRRLYVLIAPAVVAVGAVLALVGLTGDDGGASGTPENRSSVTKVEDDPLVVRFGDQPDEIDIEDDPLMVRYGR